MSEDHFPEDYKNPITGLTRKETDERFKPLYDEFVLDVRDVLGTEKYSALNIAEGLEESSSAALMRLLTQEIPQCCAGHTFESLMEIVNMFALTNMVCKSAECPEQINHEFIEYVVERFGKLGEAMEKSMVTSE